MQQQLHVWERLLQLRILLQKPLTECHRLPQSWLYSAAQVCLHLHHASTATASLQPAGQSTHFSSPIMTLLNQLRTLI